MWLLSVPKDWPQRVHRSVHGSIGARHFGVTQTLKRLRQQFYWVGCRQDTFCALLRCLHCPTRHSHAPLQQYLVGAPMECVGVVILSPFPITNTGNHYVLIAMDYFTKEAFALPVYQEYSRVVGE